VGKVNDLSGKIFHRLLVVRRNGSTKHKKALWNCLCVCGQYKTIIGSDLTSGTTKSCGCLAIEHIRELGVATRGMPNKGTLRHGMSKDSNKLPSVYRIWQNIKTRCFNKNCHDYLNYGGRGITVCDRWLEFKNFYEDMGDRPEGLSLDRIDNDGNYEPGNCRWTTFREQRMNQRRMNGKIS